MKLKDLIANREVLEKYDELKEWKAKFANAPCYCSLNGAVSFYSDKSACTFEAYPVPDHIKQIIINALDAEIKRMEEE